jgi:hypothetical protein
VNRIPDILPRKTKFRNPENLQMVFSFNQQNFNITADHPKYESIEQIVIGGFGKNEQLKKLVFMRNKDKNYSNRMISQRTNSTFGFCRHRNPIKKNQKSYFFANPLKP